MPERMIPCPECIKRRASGLPLRWNLNCSTCGIEETKVGTIPDRRKPTASDGAVERMLAAINNIMGVGGGLKERGLRDGPYWWRTQLRVESGLVYDGEKYIIREEAEHG